MDHPQLSRKPGYGRLFMVFAPLLRLALKLVPKAKPGFTGVTVFQAYQVGDLFMALPALTRLREQVAVQVIAREDCLPLLRQLGFTAVSFDHALFHSLSISALAKAISSACKLRGQLGAIALDLNADPRTALMLRLMGVTQAISYQRRYGEFFTDTFSLTTIPWHQAEKDKVVVEGFLGAGLVTRKRDGAPRPALVGAIPKKIVEGVTDKGNRNTAEKVWPEILLGCQTRKDTKNWELEKWEEILQRLLQRGFKVGFLDNPDGDEAWKAWAHKWETQALRVSCSLLELFNAMQPEGPIKAVITLDNFLGHMAGYAGRPVLWVYGSSDAKAVLPKTQGAGFVQKVAVEAMPCRPCHHFCVNTRYKACFEDLGVDQVWQATLKFLRDCGLSQEI